MLEKQRSETFLNIANTRRESVDTLWAISVSIVYGIMLLWKFIQYLRRPHCIKEAVLMGHADVLSLFGGRICLYEPIYEYTVMSGKVFLAQDRVWMFSKKKHPPGSRLLVRFYSGITDETIFKNGIYWHLAGAIICFTIAYLSVWLLFR